MINKLEPGDRQLSASSWNEMRDRINNITPSQDTVLTGNKNPFLITVKNTTGSALPALSVVKLTTPIYSRSSDTFINKGVEFGVEMNVTVPDSTTNTIAVTQSACPAGGMVKAVVSGATPAMVVGDTTVNKYARVVSGVTNYLELTSTPTNIRVIGAASGNFDTNAPGGAYIAIDSIDDRLRFKVPTNLASVAKKGAVFKIVLGSNGWEIQSNFAQSSKYILAVCQEDMDDNATEPYQMPFYTPEQNYGVAPNTLANSGIVSGSWQVGRRGVGAGDNAFSNKRLDYAYQHGQYTYEPRFIYTGAAVNLNGSVGITIEGHTYAVTFPTIYNFAGASLTSYPDVYAGDQITVLVEEAYTGDYGASVTAIEYPTDFEKGSSIVVEATMPLTTMGRGWDEDYITGTDFKYAIKVQGNALT